MQPTITRIEARLGASLSQPLVRNLALALLGSVLLTLSAKVQVPLIVPMTMQSLVVLLLGAGLGWRLGLASVMLYLAEGAAGLPVFAGTPEKGLGLDYMMGPTGGFLIGFVLAVVLAGALSERGFGKTLPGAILIMSLGHGVMFPAGFAWLSYLMGAESAYAVGIAPFFAPTLIKTALGVALIEAGSRLHARLHRD